MNIAIVVAAGNGSRMNTKQSKQFIKLQDIPVLVRTLRVFENLDEIDSILVVTRECDIEYVKKLCSEYHIKKLTAVIKGGNTRQQSVFRGLSFLDCNNHDNILIHDGARPFIKEIHIKNIITKLSSGSTSAAAVGVPVKDTIKRIDENGFIIETVERSSLISVQTPQAFKFKLIFDAHKKAIEQNLDFTDDCAVIENLTNDKIQITLGDYDNIKITTQEDIDFSESIIKKYNL